MTDILTELRKFLRDNLDSCSGIYDRYRLQLIKGTARGAYCFALQYFCTNRMTDQLTQLNKLWEEHEAAFDKLLEEAA